MTVKPTANTSTSGFLRLKLLTLASRAERLSNLTPKRVGIRRSHARFAPSGAHFAAANKRLAKIQATIRKRLAHAARRWPGTPPHGRLVDIAMVEREVDRARRTFGMFFEVFGQRSSSYAPALAAHDVIAADCYTAITRNAPNIFSGSPLKPITYLEHGYSPATMRRGVSLSRLLGESNPFPLIRIPWDRDNPWQATFLHEVSHNLQADMKLWHENKDAVTKRLLRAVGDPMQISTYSRWHKEIFADLAALLLGGTAAAWGMMDFLAHPAPRTLTYKPGGAHPTGYFRVHILAEMLRRMGFEGDSGRMRAIWTKLFDPRRGHRLPENLLSNMRRAIPQVVDEIAFQPRRNLAQRALADVIRFDARDERRIRKAAERLRQGRTTPNLPPRFLVSASRHALAAGAAPSSVSRQVISHLSALANTMRATPVVRSTGRRVSVAA